MEEGDLKVKHCSVIEWRPPRMPTSPITPVQSPSFEFRNKRYYFNFASHYNDSATWNNDYGLYLCWRWKGFAHLLIEATVIIFKGTDSITYPRKRLTMMGDEMFRDSFCAIKDRIPSFGFKHSFNFRVIFHDFPVLGE